jgi:hypothetical protein
VALLIGVAMAAVGTRFLQRRSKRASEHLDKTD